MVQKVEKSRKSSLTGRPESELPKPRLRQTAYPWDEWQRVALGRGVPEDLAALGREVMREADQHAWDAPLKALCGWEDEGEAMVGLALLAPQRARYVWRKLLATDGCRGHWDEKTGQWVSWL
jgi:hypothetical protein